MADSMTCSSGSRHTSLGTAGHSEKTGDSFEKKTLLVRLVKLARFLHIRLYGVPDSPASSSTSLYDTAVEKPIHSASLQMNKSNVLVVAGKEPAPSKEDDRHIPCSSRASGSDLRHGELDVFQGKASALLKLKMCGSRLNVGSSLCSHYSRIFSGNHTDDQMETVSSVSTSCDKIFSHSNGPMKQEQKQTDSRFHICHFCDKIFPRLSQLRYHERTHSGSRPFKCSLCPKAFSQSSNLKLHERTHSGSRPFQCSLCPKAFSQSGNLKTHERKHSGSRPFKCSLCPKAFSRSSHLKRHERTHSGSRPFKCSLCPKAFSQSSNLRRHERTHSGSRPFQCSLCLKAFSRSDSLKEHKEAHSGSRPFQSSLCPKAFSQSSHLRKHQKTHTNLKLF